jgi:hypothetical protein
MATTSGRMLSISRAMSCGSLGPWVLGCLLGGLLLGVVGPVSDLDRIPRGQPGAVHEMGDQSTNSQESKRGSHARGSGA